MSVVAIIPARYSSTRLPGKPLIDICGKSVVQRVYEAAQSCTGIDETIVATDDERILHAVEAFGGTAQMTSKNHPTGTDRVAEIAKGLDASIVVNVQGDEPFVTPEMIAAAIGPLRSDEGLPMSTLMHEIGTDQFDDSSVVKVVTDLRGNALYFSRSLIPFPRNAQGVRVFEHIGVYCYQRSFLLAFVELPQSPLERVESLEQLRALENGYSIRVIEIPVGEHATLSIDTPDDVERARQIFDANPGGGRDAGADGTSARRQQ